MRWVVVDPLGWDHVVAVEGGEFHGSNNLAHGFRTEDREQVIRDVCLALYRGNDQMPHGFWGMKL